jgi:hypothetical protein
MYKEGVWVPANRARMYGNAILVALGCNQRLARSAYNSGRQLWNYYPKHHMIHHSAVDLLQDGARLSWVLNPLVWSCQMAEDYVGKPARLSRRVNIRSIHMSTVLRVLASVGHEFHELEKSLREKRAHSLRSQLA